MIVVRLIRGVLSMANELVTLATFDNSIKAELARSALANAGIDARLGDEDLATMLPSNMVGGVKLIVREEDAERAIEIYREIEAHLNADSNIDDDELERQAMAAASESGETEDSIDSTAS